MTAREWINKNGMLVIGSAGFIGAIVLIGSFVFAPAEHLEGTIIEKIYVPAERKVGPTPYGGVRRRPYSVTVVPEEQWIAIVLTERGDTLKVHCHPGHHAVKNVGDRIKFREYEGSLIHIDYFAHGEEEDGDQ